MTTRPSTLTLVLAGLILAASVMGILLGETIFDMTQMRQAFADPASGPAEVLWQVRAPRVATALLSGRRWGCRAR